MRNIVILTLNLLLGQAVASEGRELSLYFWDNQDGLVRGENCQLHAIKESPFRITSYTGRGKSLTENLRNFAGIQQGHVPTGSLVKIDSSKREKTDFAGIEMISDNLGNKVERHQWFADRGDSGYLFHRSLLPAEDFVIELGLEAPLIEGIPQFGDLVGTKLTLVSESQYYKLNCENIEAKNRDYLVFKAYAPSDLHRPSALFGISKEETEILKNISTEAKLKVAESLPALNLEARLVHLLGENSSVLKPAETENKKIEEAEIASSNELEEELKNAEPKEESFIEEIVGGFQNVVCISAEKLNVRSDDLSKIIFKARLGEPVKIFQSFSGNSKTATLNGETYRFIKVQFPEREESDQKVGWVAEMFIKHKSQCKYLEEEEEALISRTPVENISGLDDQKCCEFPTLKKPTHDFTSGARAFGAGRSGGKRKHAACDLYRELREPILSVAPGKVIRDRYHFYQGTYALEVVHSGGFVVRYGELDAKTVPGMNKGKEIKMSEKIGYMGKVNSNCCRPMLHFELFKGTATGGLSTGGSGFQRRSDLLNPTSYLLKWESEKF